MMNTKHVSVKVWMLAGVAAVAVVVAMSATAEPGRRGGRGGHGGGHGDGECAEDVKRLCGDVEKGEGRIHECLQSKIGEVSAVCAEKMERGAAHHAKREAFKNTCGEEVKRLCGAEMGPPPGEGDPDDGPDADDHGPGRGKHKQMKACIDAHEAELSTECRAMITEMKAEHEGRKARHGAVREACAADVTAFCGDIKAEGKGKRRAIRECLQTHERQLSGECSAAIQAAHAE
jgi:hypothetical protein